MRSTGRLVGRLRPPPRDPHCEQCPVALAGSLLYVEIDDPPTGLAQRLLQRSDDPETRCQKLGRKCLS